MSEATPADWRRVVEALGPFTKDSRLSRLEETLAKRRGDVHLVLENIADPFNVAAVLRTAEGLGVQHVHAIESISSFRVPTPGQIGNRAARGAIGSVAMGASRWLSVERYTSSADCYSAIRDLGLHVIASHCPCVDHEGEQELNYGLHSPELGEALAREARRRAAESGESADDAEISAHPLDEIELPADRGVAIVFGNERRGVSRTFLQLADERFYLRMSGLTQSFNISVAVAMSLFAIVATGRYPEGTLHDDERAEILGRWLLRDVKGAKPLLRAQAGIEFDDF